MTALAYYLAHILADGCLFLYSNALRLNSYFIDSFWQFCDDCYKVFSYWGWFEFVYEKYLFFLESKSYRYYTRIQWKPSLNISDHLLNVPIFFVLQTMFLVIITVWARAVGPRMRMDQLSQFVWKDFVPCLTLVLLVILIIMLF